VEADEVGWNRALRAWFFRADLADRPVYLAVDQETLTAIAKEFHLDVQDATESLSRVVQTRISPRSPLEWWVSQAVRWRQAGSKSDPPFLPLLAVTVLAATIVDDVNDRSYYRRLNSLLGLPGHVMPHDFDSDIQQLWTYLNEWLTDVHHGQLGVATASNAGRQANVGWAQSQILLRPSDRARLPLFFTALGVQPGQLVDGDLLVRRLASWSAGSHGFSRRLAAVLQDTGLSELLAAALHSELSHWDGTLRDEAGRVALKLLLAFHERSGQLQAAVQVPEQLAGTTWHSGSLEGPLRLETAGELQLIGVEVTAQVLDGLAIQAESDGTAGSDAAGMTGKPPSSLRLIMSRRDVHLLCPDDRLARWVEVPSALLHRPHLVLVRSGAASAAERIMGELGGDAQPVRRIHCPAVWAAYRFTPARLQVIDGPLAVLSPRGTELSALQGGLPISKRARVYLTGGAPDLVLDLREPSGVVTVDEAVAQADASGRVRLAKFALPPGRHSASVGGVHYQVTLIDQLADGPRDSNLAFAFDIVCRNGAATGTAPAGMTSLSHQGPGDITVSGAAIRMSRAARAFVPLRRPPRARAGGRHFVLGRPGQAVAVRAQPPRWLESLPVRLAPHLVDVEAVISDLPFAPEWLLRVSQAGTTVSAIDGADYSQANSPGSRAAEGLWLLVLPYIANAVSDADDARLWSDWQEAALTGAVPPEADAL
jgi:hypothetical protein